MMPDQYIIEIHFWSTESMKKVYSILDTIITDNSYELVAIPKTIYSRDESSHLFDLKLSPASLLHVRFKEKLNTLTILQPQYKSLIKKRSLKSSLSSLQDKSEKAIKKIPKWLKLKK